MKILLAVIQDLYTFAVQSIFGRTSKAVDSEKNEDVIFLESPFETKSAETNPVDSSADSFKRVGEVMEAAVAPTPLSDARNTVMYVGSAETPLFKKPTQEFDTVIKKLGYATMVMVIEQKGRWARVSENGTEGWVLREDLVDRAVYVYPSFTIGEQNLLDDPNTLRVRAILNDMYNGAISGLPLQAGEYVTYRLLRKGITIPWGEIKQRVPGLWHSLLKGMSGIHIGVAPKTGSIMEFMFTEEMGHLAYVEAVFPDETINISEVNYPDVGIYNERVLTREEWRELKPVFIQCT